MPSTQKKPAPEAVIETVEEPTHAELMLAEEQTSWSPVQLSALHAMGVSEQATEAELDIFLHVAKRSQLDPFSRQIYLVARKDRAYVDGEWTDVSKSTIQTGIDGYRVIARRAADKAGVSLEYEDVQWCGQDGQWSDVWLDATSPPSAAKVTVLRDGKRFSAVALFVEYAQTKRKPNDDIILTGTWRTRGAGQLAKCAEALALRKAFPLDLSGIYTDEEMGQADNPEGATIIQGSVVQRTDEPDADAGDLDAALKVERPQSSPQQPEGDWATIEQQATIGDLLTKHNYGRGDGRDRVGQIVGRVVPNRASLTSAEADAVIEELTLEPYPES